MELVAFAMTDADPDAVITHLGELQDRHDAIVQGIDARYVAGSTHAAQAVRLTRRAIERETTIADDASMELLLYLAGTRQIDRAVEIGIGTQTDTVLALIDGPDEEAIAEVLGDRYELVAWEESTDPVAVREWFAITDAEERVSAASLADLVGERVALLQLDA